MLKLKKESGRDNCIKLRDNDLISWLICGLEVYFQGRKRSSNAGRGCYRHDLGKRHFMSGYAWRAPGRA